jgi:two-component system, sensor histidine kinase and response regulator
MADATIHVLLVEDSPIDARLLRDALERVAPGRFVVTHTERLNEALQCLKEARFDVLLLDLGLPDSQGLQTFTQVYAQAPAVPIVILTGLDDETLALEAVRTGAQDYLPKAQLAGHTLARAMRYAMERTQAAGRLRRLNDELEQQGSERTADLQAAYKELEAFAYSIAHDLRAPLGAIHGFTAIVLRNSAPQLDANTQGYLQCVQREAMRMGQLIDGLLAFSRYPQEPLTKQPVALADLVRQVLDDLRHDDEDRRVDIAIGALPSCEADPTLLKQALTNLLGNALKFTRGREVAHITIGCQHIDDEPVYFIRDNGVGFDMQYAHKLFGVFQRLHREEDFEGTGIGLAFTQRIIQRHGGRIWAEAEVDKGATFYFTL